MPFGSRGFGGKDAVIPWWLGGALALALITLLTFAPLAAMLFHAGDISWRAILGNSYIQRVVQFSITQALWSTALSLLGAIPLALALSHSPGFRGRSLLINLLSISLVIPTIVAIYGIVAVYGRTGWVSSGLALVNFPPLNIYGLPGILIAHVFFNLPLATRILLMSLEGIPLENWRLARQLGMKPWSLWRHIEWPNLRSQLPGLAILIFSLCFTSFAIVMTLGGGPRATTIEVAIYQALRFDFNIGQATALACLQLLICIGLMAMSTLAKHDINQKFSLHAQQPDANTKPYRQLSHKDLWNLSGLNLIHYAIIIISTAFIILPLLALLLSSINTKTFIVLTDTLTLTALGNTIIASLCAATLSVGMALGLLLTSRHLRIRLKQESSGQSLQLMGNTILVLPPLVLGTGLFLLLRPFADVFSLALLLVILINSLMALPFIIRILDGPIMKVASQHDCLLQSLGIRGWGRWRWIDWPTLRRPIALSVAVSATLSAGDLSAIALFGSERIRTLPLLLYQRMGSYRLEEAAVTAGILMLTCLLLFIGLQRLIGGSAYARA